MPLGINAEKIYIGFALCEGWTSSIDSTAPRFNMQRLQKTNTKYQIYPPFDIKIICLSPQITEAYSCNIATIVLLYGKNALFCSLISGKISIMACRKMQHRKFSLSQRFCNKIGTKYERKSLRWCTKYMFSGHTVCGKKWANIGNAVPVPHTPIVWLWPRTMENIGPQSRSNISDITYYHTFTSTKTVNTMLLLSNL